MTEQDEFIGKFINLASRRQNQTIVIFLSSGAITNSKILAEMARDIMLLITLGMEIFIVHDFGNLAKIATDSFKLEPSQMFAELGPRYLADIASMILCQQVAAEISKTLDEHDLMNIALSGQNYNLIQTKKMRHSFVDYNSGSNMQLGLPSKINTSLLDELSKSDIICLISPVGSVIDTKQPIILEPHITASMLASSLAADIMLLLTNDKSSADAKVTYPLNSAESAHGAFEAFAAPIQMAYKQALEGGVEEVIMANESANHTLLNSLM